MSRTSYNNIHLRQAEKGDALFIQYLFGFKDIADRCMVQEGWACDTATFIEGMAQSTTNWVWIIEDSNYQPVGVLMNNIAPCINGLPALWSTYGIMPKARKKHYAENALKSVPTLFKDTEQSYMCEALLIANGNVASEIVARRAGFKKTNLEKGVMLDGSITNDELWIKLI
jgi:hypothetical protein